MAPFSSAIDKTGRFELGDKFPNLLRHAITVHSRDINRFRFDTRSKLVAKPSARDTARDFTPYRRLSVPRSTAHSSNASGSNYTESLV
jgi:hypothetical protein